MHDDPRVGRYESSYSSNLLLGYLHPTFHCDGGWLHLREGLVGMSHLREGSYSHQDRHPIGARSRAAALLPASSTFPKQKHQADRGTETARRTCCEQRKDAGRGQGEQSHPPAGAFKTTSLRRGQQGDSRPFTSGGAHAESIRSKGRQASQGVVLS